MKLNSLLLAAALTAVAIVTAFSIPSAAAAELPVLEISSGQEGGTYQKFMSQAADLCHNEVQTHITLSPNGSEGNIDALQSNSVSIAPVQGDYLYLASQTQDLSNLKTALVLFPEQVHIVTLIESKHMVGGKMGTSFGQHALQIDTLADLGPGTTVGTSGGGKVTSQLIKQWANLGYTIVPFPDAKATLNAMIAGQIDAAIVVGAAPMDLFRGASADLKNRIKFVSIPDSIIPSLKSYIPSKVGYPGINNGVAAQTVSVQSVLITQNYGKKSPMAPAVYAFKQCLLEHAEEKAGTTGSHPAWRYIKADSVPKWPAWEYDPATAATPVKKAAKK